MRRTPIGWALFLLTIGALAAAGWVGFTSVGRLRHDAAALAAFNDLALKAQVNLGELRQTLVASVEEPRGRSVATAWTTRVRTLEADVAGLKEVSGDGEGLNSIEAAAAVLETIGPLDELAGAYSDDRRWRTSVDALTAAAARIEAARKIELASAQARSEGGYLQLAYASGAAAMMALLALVLAPTFTRGRDKESAPVETMADGNLSTDSETTTAVATSSVAATGPEPASALPPTLVNAESGEPASGGVPRLDRRKATELRALAGLCTDFARLRDPIELPALLERAARTMDASGFIVWMSDAQRAQLRPALAHGYSAHALARMPAISRVTNNPTAVAWREVSTQVVQTNGMTPGALVVPLLTPEGCVGVLAAEVVHGRESSAAVAATAEIVGAMLSTLVSAPNEVAGRTEPADLPRDLAAQA